ncbi:hypothetical protein [Oryzomonas rubra]|uniref:Uncharacterized protein n=1 Tax=Oryzomonas rubra TaxID=2509454 RepID=A0A5A9X988_9BACT|nr:hypothetical protein [Oryzomonas rubra]KAA0888769.1 hypothetical protein ET418_15425 [Oryzomonas rubra]
MTDEEITLEYEMHLAADGKSLKTCFKCGYKTYRDQCPECGVEISSDSTADEILERLENGEDIDLEEILRGDQWKPVEVPKQAGA